MRLVSSNLGNYLATEQKLLVRQVVNPVANCHSVERWGDKDTRIFLSHSAGQVEGSLDVFRGSVPNPARFVHLFIVLICAITLCITDGHCHFAGITWHNM